MNAHARLAVASCLVLAATACSRPPAPPSAGWPNRAAFHGYVDGIASIPDQWKEALKSGTNEVSGKFINNMANYLKLQGEPVMALCKKYGMDAEMSYDGVDISPAIARAKAELIAAGDKANGEFTNNWWLTKEDVLKNGDWSWEDKSLMDTLNAAAGRNNGGVLAPGTSEGPRTDDGSASQ